MRKLRIFFSLTLRLFIQMFSLKMRINLIQVIFVCFFCFHCAQQQLNNSVSYDHINWKQFYTVAESDFQQINAMQNVLTDMINFESHLLQSRSRIRNDVFDKMHFSFIAKSLGRVMKIVGFNTVMHIFISFYLYIINLYINLFIYQSIYTYI